MIYLAIIVLLAGGGIFRLWLYQRREAKLDHVDEFWNGLERLAEPTPAPKAPARMVRPSTRPTTPNRAPAPLDPARRAAAKRRIEARRRAMQVDV